MNHEIFYRLPIESLPQARVRTTFGLDAAELDVGGHLFIHCANPPRGGPETPFGDDPRLLRVDKHHSLIFEAGREVDVVRLPDGRNFVQVIAASPGGGGLLQKADAGTGTAEIPLSEGWSLRSETLSIRPTATPARRRICVMNSRMSCWTDGWSVWMSASLR